MVKVCSDTSKRRTASIFRVTESGWGWWQNNGEKDTYWPCRKVWQNCEHSELCKGERGRVCGRSVSTSYKVLTVISTSTRNVLFSWGRRQHVPPKRLNKPLLHGVNPGKGHKLHTFFVSCTVRHLWLWVSVCVFVCVFVCKINYNYISESKVKEISPWSRPCMLRGQGINTAIFFFEHWL